MSNKDLLADEGVYSVGRVFQKELMWIFRDQPKADYGIDALVEICNKGTPTGQLVAVQIKSGESFFKEYNETGFIFRFNNWHHKYWTNHCLPVIVALYNPVDELIFWEKIHPDKIQTTGKAWKVTVPYKNLLKQQSGREISDVSIAVDGGYEKIDQYAYFNNTNVSVVEKVIAPLMNCIRNTRTEILVSAPYIDSDFLSVLNIVSYTAKVKIITTPNLEDHIESTIRYHESKSDNLIIKRSRAIHDRFVIIDRKFVFMSSMNFQQGSFHKRISTHELILPITDKKRVSEYFDYFTKVWSNINAIQDI